ncbi:uncharacterized protein BX663DRAFT_532705 [Cokeromyces recurvatus]|uniref:uncharacterized protein n=1 Tax=Cokeromyces recurvatus TaxID=90255 RepID=UPI00221EDF9D|nr:uncharacterized protein BX663DRAFT_532705 [Cokeromyces recurvatus]KAI7899745.1 hypothetical protein BX663DRAFT_532705 [Cokeromyces recurvatus]
MEIIGQGFNLPLEDMAITNDDIEIYARWLLEQNVRPQAIVQDGLEQEFYQIIFHHFSFLFQPRIARAQAASPVHDNTPTNLNNSTSKSTSSSFHINMIPVGAHNGIIPLAFNTSSNNSTQTNPSNPQTSAIKETLSQLVQRHIELCKKTLKVIVMAGRTLRFSEETWLVLLKVMLGITDYLLKEPVGETSSLGVMNMADELCDNLLQVLFELWLRSATMNVEMWDILKNCFARWTHRSKAIQQWSSTSLALTRRIQNLIYGEKEGTDGVYINGLNIKLDLPNEFVYYAWHRVIYFIPHPLKLPSTNFTLSILGIGNLVDALNSSNSSNADGKRDNPNTPDGNTILHMFGTYLFDAASKALNANQEQQCGCAEAFATLCKIFCKPQRREPFLRTYIERFYAALIIGLKSDACLPTILLSCTDLFTTDLEGIRMLVPNFISAIRMVLPKLRFVCKTNVSIDNLRLAAIKVLSTIMCMPNHFDKVEFKSGWDCEINNQNESSSLIGEQEQLITELIRVLYDTSNPEDSKNLFLSLKYYILEVLLMSLKTETSSYNMRYILHLINVYVIEDVPFCPGLVGTVVKLIQDKILTMQLPADVTLVAFDVLMDFVNLYDFVKRDSKNVARELVLALSRYVDKLITTGNLSQTYPLIVQAYDCMIKWILVSQWIIDDYDCYKAVIDTLSKGITIFEREPVASPTTSNNHIDPVNAEKKKKRDAAFPQTKQLFQLPPRVNKGNHHSNHHYDNNNNNLNQAMNTHNSPSVRKKEEAAVRMAAEYCMSQFVNQLGRFMIPYEHSLGGFRPAIVDDLQQLKELKSQDKDLSEMSSIRCFLIDKRSLLTIIDITNQMHKDGEPNNAPHIVAIIRDTTGKYIWSMEIHYKENKIPAGSPELKLSSSSMDSEKKSECKGPKETPAQKIIIPTVTAVNEDGIPDMDKIFVENSDEWKQWETIKSLMSRQEESKKLIINQYKNEETSKPRGSRLLLSHIGYLLPENRKHITSLCLNDTTIHEIEKLDELNERDCISISAYYAKSGNITLLELIEKPPPLSQEFIQFIHCLGWPIKTSYHKGYKGRLDASISDTIPYFSDRTTEFLVHVPYFIRMPPDNDTKWGKVDSFSSLYQDVSSDDHVCVIWIEDLSNYKSLANLIKTSNPSNSKAMVYIFINPLKNGANGLYLIKILIPSVGNTPSSILASQRLNENALIFGPLVDGIVVSRHALGAMVRSTAISAHQACRVVTDTYTRPYAIRKAYIEDLAHRHRTKLPLSQ